MLDCGSLGPGFAAWKEFCFSLVGGSLDGQQQSCLELDALLSTRAAPLDCVKAFLCFFSLSSCLFSLHAGWILVTRLHRIPFR